MTDLYSFLLVPLRQIWKGPSDFGIGVGGFSSLELQGLLVSWIGLDYVPKVRSVPTSTQLTLEGFFAQSCSS